MRAPRPGFTLIELMIVIVIVGIVASIGVSRFWAARERAQVTAMKNDLRSMATHQELYFNKAMSYAGALADLADFRPSTGVTINITFATPNGWAVQATSSRLAEQCGYFYGNAPVADGAPATVAGVIYCE